MYGQGRTQGASKGRRPATGRRQAVPRARGHADGKPQRREGARRTAEPGLHRAI